MFYAVQSLRHGEDVCILNIEKKNLFFGLLIYPLICSVFWAFRNFNGLGGGKLLVIFVMSFLMYSIVFCVFLAIYLFISKINIKHGKFLISVLLIISIDICFLRYLSRTYLSIDGVSGDALRLWDSTIGVRWMAYFFARHVFREP